MGRSRGCVVGAIAWWLGAGCTPLSGDPAADGPATIGIRLQVQQGSVVREAVLTAFYLRTASSTPRVLATRTALLSTGTVTVPFTVPLAECLADPARAAAPEGACPVQVAVALRDQGGGLIDSVSTNVVATRPGDSVTPTPFSFSVPGSIDLLTPDTLLIGASQVVQATVRDSGGVALPNRPVTWTSSVPAVATISSQGLVAATGIGRTIITARSLSTSAARELVVAPRPSLALTDTAFNLTPAIGDANPAPLVVGVSNAGGGTLGNIRVDSVVYVTGTTNWITNTSLSQPTSPASLSISPAISTLASGTYRARVFIGATSAGVASRVVDVSVVVSFRATALVSGLFHTCGRVPSGAWYCWGTNAGGHLGIGSLSASSPTPRRVSAPSGVTFERLYAGRGHTCGIATNGDVYCWGVNVDGVLGSGAADGPVSVPTLASATQGLGLVELDGGAAHTCGRTNAGAIWCWGSARWCEIGNGTCPLAPVFTPALAQLPPGVSATALDAGWLSNCVLTAASQVYCWGYNATGELGIGTTQWMSTPTLVQPPPGVVFSQVERNETQACARSVAGAIYCWGPNQWGQVGAGPSAPSQVLSPTAIQLSQGVTFAEVIAAASAACGRTNAGQLYCWGSNRSGELARGVVNAIANPVPEPIVMPPGEAFVEVVGGGDSFCARTAAGLVFCWGRNTEGQLGIGIVGPPVATPTRIP